MDLKRLPIIIVLLELGLSLFLICPTLNCVGRALTLISFYSYPLSTKENEVKQGKKIS